MTGKPVVQNTAFCPQATSILRSSEAAGTRHGGRNEARTSPDSGVPKDKHSESSNCRSGGRKPHMPCSMDPFSCKAIVIGLMLSVHKMVLQGQGRICT
eukprot:1161132-Pelagomonas_calceolata.AAC.4